MHPNTRVERKFCESSTVFVPGVFLISWVVVFFIRQLLCFYVIGMLTGFTRILAQIHQSFANEGYNPGVFRARQTSFGIDGRKVLVPSANKCAALQ